MKNALYCLTAVLFLGATAALFAQAPTYTISTSSSPLDGGWTTGSGTYSNGASVMVCASSNTCYHFVDWTESSSEVSTSICYSFTATANRTLVANFEPVAGTPLNHNWSTIAGAVTNVGSADGTNNAARFNYPTGVAADSAGNIFVADTDNSIIRELTPVGTNWVVTTIAGMAGSCGSADGTNNAARFCWPGGVAVDSAGNIFVADTHNSTIRELTPVGTNWVVTTIAGMAWSSGSADGTNNAARFCWPGGVAVDSAGNVFVADTHNSTIRELTPVGTNWVVTTIAGMAWSSGSADGTNNAARFNYPAGVAVDNAGNVFVADTGNNAIRELTPVGTNWVITTIAGMVGGTLKVGSFQQPSGVAVDSAGNVFVADTHNSTIRELTPAGTNWVITTIAGMAGSCGSADGTNNAARFNYPAGVAVDSAGNVFVADTDNSTIRRGALLSSFPSYIVATSGWPSKGGSVSGGGIVACGSNVTVCAMPNGCYGFANWTEDGKVVSTSPCYTFTAESSRILVANFVAAYADDFYVTTWGTNEYWETDFDTVMKVDRTIDNDPSLFANLGSNGPLAMAFDNQGNLYVANYLANTIEKFDTVGNGTVFASSGLSGPAGLAFDDGGNLYVANMDGNTIMRFDANGNGTVFASSGLNGPVGLAFDSGGNLYVANYMGNTVVKFDPSANRSVFASLELDGPAGLAFDSGGNLYVANYLGNSIAKITPDRHVSYFNQSDLLAPFGLAFDCGGNLFVTAYESGGGWYPEILEFYPDGEVGDENGLGASGWAIAVRQYPASSVNDGIPDTWRAQYFGGVGSKTNSFSCVTCDADGTGQNNLFKYVAGLDPTNPASVFALRIANVADQPTQKNLIFTPEVGGRTYTPQFCTNLAGGTWAALSGVGGPVTNISINQVTVTDLNATQTNKFYRLQITSP